MSDSHLNKLWRQAVLKTWENTCVMCGQKDLPENLECHHYVKRRVKVLKYDWRNGFPLHSHKGCHREAHTKGGERKLQQIMGEGK
jgi:hypothetical protein